MRQAELRIARDCTTLIFSRGGYSDCRFPRGGYSDCLTEVALASGGRVRLLDGAELLDSAANSSAG